MLPGIYNNNMCINNNNNDIIKICIENRTAKVFEIIPKIFFLFLFLFLFFVLKIITHGYFHLYITKYLPHLN